MMMKENDVICVYEGRATICDENGTLFPLTVETVEDVFPKDENFWLTITYIRDFYTQLLAEIERQAVFAFQCEQKFVSSCENKVLRQAMEADAYLRFQKTKNIAKIIKSVGELVEKRIGVDLHTAKRR